MRRLLLIIALAMPCSASVLTVGPGKTYATISLCLAAATSGDVCEVYASTYTEQVTLKANVTVRNHAGDTVNLQSTSSPVVTAVSSSSITADSNGHFNVTYNGSGSAPIGINHGHGSDINSVTVTNIVFTIASGSGSGFGLYIADCDTCIVTGNTFHISSTSGSHDGVQFLFNSNLTFTGNLVYGEPCSAATHLEDGLVATGVNLNISNNILHDGCSFDNHPDAVVIQGDGDRSGNPTDNVTIANNTIYNFTQGVYIDAIHAAMTNILAYNNVIYEQSSYRYGGVANKMNCAVLDGESLSGPHWPIQVGFYNNTLDCKQLHIYTLRLVAGAAITIRNNISLSTPFTGLYYDDNTGVTVNYDYFSGSNATPIHWGASNYSRATFISNGFGEANSAAGTANLNSDYSEKSVSPTRSIGVDLSAIFTTDILGNPRGSVWDIGAFQYIPTPNAYFIKNGGSDAANGLTDGTAWATLVKVNGFACSTGDIFQFKRGGTWNEQTDAALIPACSGTTYTDYDSGALPIFDGHSAVANGVNVASKSNVTINNLQIQNTTAYSVLLNGCNTCTVSNTVLSNSAVHGINIIGVSPSCTLDSNSYTTSSSFDMTGKAFNVATTSGTCTITDNSIDLSNVLNTRNVSGIVCSASTTGCIVDSNTIVMDQGVQGIGIKATGSGDATAGQITANSITGLTNICTGCDGEAIELTGSDASHEVSGTLVRGNYVKNGGASADCIGLFWAPSNTVSYNLCIGNSSQNADFHITTSSPNNKFYGNNGYEADYCFEFIGATVTGSDVQNNICGTHRRGIGFFTSATGTYSYNISYNNSIANFVGGTDGGNNLTTDPKWTSSTPSSPNDFKLLGTSPGVLSGHNLGSTYQVGNSPVGSFPYAQANQNTVAPKWARGAILYVVPIFRRR